MGPSAGRNAADAVLDDPTKASAEAGRDLLAATIPAYTEIVREALG
jgi:creatinine amidohydrolase/Fe(II)-dependent formamide hydrolase-like protein